MRVHPVVWFPGCFLVRMVERAFSSLVPIGGDPTCVSASLLQDTTCISVPCLLTKCNTIIYKNGASIKSFVAIDRKTQENISLQYILTISYSMH